MEDKLEDLVQERLLNLNIDLRGIGPRESQMREMIDA